MPPADQARRAATRRRAVLMVMGAAGIFAVAGAFVKALGGEVPLAQVVLCRNLFAIPALLPLLWQAGGVRALRTRNPGLHGLRLIGGLLGMVGTFYGLTVLPIATVTALGFTMPLFLTLLSIPLLGERVGPRRGLAVLAGFGGVLLMTLPTGAAGGSLSGLGAVLLGALGWALAMISIRRMGDAGEANVTIVLWFAFGATLLSALAAIPVWVPPTPGQWALLAGIGLVSAVAQLMMTDAYRRGEATLLAPFEYSAILWTTALGVLVWAELPDGWDLAGMAVLVGSGLYIWHREVTLGLRR
ncbi:DMT family transporter [Paracraurococcus ruber]|uniref:EamA family transporter n=2 Tax=Paracraurococcus ruber TaxID=77675 RepID=A0ABS1CYZ7_9PROT|nr:DMT family transporter [Paracraurococcus ruber]MBK1659242.1 EamA family transporter [Paracraurococcus ruber]TDG31769.1 DMT family transporter [Paracraurococcus ruber]